MPERLSTILRTKLHRPRIPSDLILRSHLLDQLNEGLDRRLTLVCAPAGFGKTTLVSLWIESLISNPDSLPVAWLSLDNDDSDIVLFTYYLIAALRTIFNDACPETLQLLNGLKPPPLKLISTTLSNEIEQFPNSFILVLDDYHTIQGEEVPSFLNQLLQHWPRTLHLVLISRNNPPLPLPRLRANGNLTEIRSNQLRFNRAETAAFLNKALTTHLNESSIDVMNERSEGWVGALRLASLSLRSTTNVNDRIMKMSGSDENIAGYLADEVLAQQIPVIHTFLMKTSILDRFCAPLCEAVIGGLDPAWGVQACIDWLESEGLFIVSLDDRRYWYRYHPLFLDLLKDRALLEYGAEQVANLHRRASSWFDQQGMLNQALHHSLATSDVEQVARLLSKNLVDALNREDRLTLDRWLHLLPKEFIQKRPELLIIKAWVYQFSWQLDAQIKLLEQVEALMDSDQGAALPAGIQQALRGQIAALKAQYAYFINQPDLAQRYCHEALALLPESWAYVRGGMMFYLSLSMRASGESQKAERLLLDHYSAVTDKTSIYALQLIHALCLIYLYNADLDQVYQAARLLLFQSKASELVIRQGWAHFYLGTVLYQWNNLKAAAGHFAQLAKHYFAVQALNARDGITSMVLIHHIMGDNEAAWKMLDLLSQIDLERMGAEMDSTRSLRARLNLLEGDLKTAMRWADGFSIPPPNQPLTWMETPHLTLVRILLARGLPEDILKANQILDALADIAEKTYNMRFMIEILALRALALDAQGDSDASLEALKRAIDLAWTGGSIRVFVDLGPDMRTLLGELARKGYSAEWIQKICDAFPKQDLISEADGVQSPTIRPTSVVASSAPVESLTTREREVLMYLREPTSLKEIAIRLSVSYATVKRHTINIYGKLGVNSRWDAVAKATELGLLYTR